MSENRLMTFERLLDWIEGRLPEEEAAAISRLVSEAGASAQDTVAWIRAFTGFSENTVLAEPPGDLRERLEHTFERYHEEEDRLEPAGVT